MNNALYEDLILDMRNWIQEQPWYKKKGESKVDYQVTEEGKKEYFKLTGKEWKGKEWSEIKGEVIS